MKKKPKLKEGDLFYYGMLGQLWLVKSVNKKLRAVIVSFDSGWGHWEDIEDIENTALLEGNDFEFAGNIRNYNPT